MYICGGVLFFVWPWGRGPRGRGPRGRRGLGPAVAAVGLRGGAAAVRPMGAMGPMGTYLCVSIG